MGNCVENVWNWFACLFAPGTPKESEESKIAEAESHRACLAPLVLPLIKYHPIMWFRFLPNHNPLNIHISYLMANAYKDKEILANCVRHAVRSGYADTPDLRSKIRSSIRSVRCYRAKRDRHSGYGQAARIPSDPDFVAGTRRNVRYAKR